MVKRNPPLGVEMKNVRLVIGIVVILALVCSPVLAISKADLISQYKSQSSPAMPIPTPTQIPIVTPTSTIPSWLPSINGTFFQPFFDLKEKILADKRGEYWKTIPDIPVAKPNIYLYSDRDLTAQVRLAPENSITVSEPVYQPGKGWLAKIRNGSLNGEGGFLFYEGLVPDAGWQKQEGFVVREAFREQDMAAILGQYGFNDKETHEFIDYWSQHLTEDVNYVFYPQETEAVNRVMPLSVSPEPDRAMRIWFYAEPLVTAPEPVTHPEKIVREGFYVVEWGVMIR
jgi:hypothetical protein